MLDTQWIVLTLMGILIAGLVFTRIRPVWLFIGVVLVSFLTNILSLETLLKSFTNPSLLTLILLLLISVAVEKTRLISWVGQQLDVGSLGSVLLKLGFSTALLSSVTNNTAVVASLISAVKRNNRHAPSRLLIPLSYAAIFGGGLTLIGTSTNLIINGFVIEAGLPALGFFQFSLVGLAGLVAGMLVLLLLRRQLPERQSSTEAELPYALEAQVAEGSPLIGKTVAESGLRALRQLYLAELLRDKQIIFPVTPDTILQAGDKLLFCGDVEGVGLLQDIRGLNLFGQTELKGQHLIEVMVGHAGRLDGKTLADVEFRERYDAVVVAIRRGEERVRGGLGQIRLQAGDMLLLAPGKTFQTEDIRKSFIWLNGAQASTRLSRRDSSLVLLGFVGVIMLALSNILPLIKGLLVLLIILLGSKVLSLQEIKQKFPMEIWLIVGSALSLAHLMIDTGLAQQVGEAVLGRLHLWESGLTGPLADLQLTPLIAFIATYLLTLFMTELITNNAAAALVFPIAFSLATGLGLDPMPYILAVIFGATASFISPYGYQTNLMVYSAGQYKITDYLRIGVPTSLVYSGVVLMVIPLLFPFQTQG